MGHRYWALAILVLAGMAVYGLAAYALGAFRISDFRSQASTVSADGSPASDGQPARRHEEREPEPRRETGQIGDPVGLAAKERAEDKLDTQQEGDQREGPRSVRMLRPKPRPEDEGEGADQPIGPGIGAEQPGRQPRHQRIDHAACECRGQKHRQHRPAAKHLAHELAEREYENHRHEARG